MVWVMHGHQEQGGHPQKSRSQGHWWPDDGAYRLRVHQGWTPEWWRERTQHHVLVCGWKPNKVGGGNPRSKQGQVWTEIRGPAVGECHSRIWRHQPADSHRSGTSIATDSQNMAIFKSCDETQVAHPACCSGTASRAAVRKVHPDGTTDLVSHAWPELALQCLQVQYCAPGPCGMQGGCWIDFSLQVALRAEIWAALRRQVGAIWDHSFCENPAGKTKRYCPVRESDLFGQKRGIRFILGGYHFWHARGSNCAQECHAIPSRKFDEGQRGTMEFPTRINRSETEMSKVNAYAWHSALRGRRGWNSQKNWPGTNQQWGGTASPNRPDAQHCIRELASHLVRPTESQYRQLEHLTCYLKGSAGYAVRFPKTTRGQSVLKPKLEENQQPEEHLLEIFTDSDWGGNKTTRKSVSVAHLYWNGTLIYTLTRTQKAVALSSREPEYVAMTTGASEGVLLNNCIEFLTGKRCRIVLRCDSNSARAFCNR